MSQSFDLSPPDDPDIQQWIPQPSTNEFEPPRIISFGQENEQYHIELTFQLDMADMLKIAFDHFIINNTKYTIHPVTHVISLHVPTNMLFNNNARVYVVLQNRSNQQNIIDSWFVTDVVLNRKRTSSDFSSSGGNNSGNFGVKRQRSITASNTAGSNTANTSMQQEVQNPFMPNYYGLPNPPYVGLPPTQPSPRPSREFFHDDAMMYPFRSPDTTSTSGTFQYDNTSFVSPIQNPMMMQQPIPPPPHQHSHSHSQSGNLIEILPSNPSQQQQHVILPQPTTTSASSSISPTIRPPPASIITTTNTTTTNTSQQASSSSQLSPDMYANLLHKADLVIEGDLMDMTKGWNDEEIQAQRRLVRFYRRQDQDNNKRVICRFEPLAPASNYKNMIIVSCIYWKDNNDYYITSVDCIYLLESLIGVTFTVEEKNRVRRNLEGFKPLTVSKLKPSSSEFFKLIMAFPNPKPRNIEKDVKIFPWSILETALKKIISKYTASYSSTASVNYDVLTTTSLQ